MRVLRPLAAFAAVFSLAAASAAAAEVECVDKKAEKAALELVLAPPSAADMCLLDSSQCAPSAPIPTPAEYSPPQAPPQMLVSASPPLLVPCRAMTYGAERADGARDAVTRDLLRPPR